MTALSPYRWILRGCLLFAGGACAASALAADAPSSLHGVPIKPFVQVPALDAHVRYAAGVLVERHYLPFHVVLLYVGPGPIDPKALGDGAARCRIEIHWLVGTLDQEQAAAWWAEQFERSSADPQTHARMKDSLQRVIHAFGAASRGDQLAIDYDPEQGLMVTRGDAATERFAGLGLARAVLGLWLGPDAGTDLFAAAPIDAAQ